MSDQVKYSCKKPYISWLCFRCATLWALGGFEIETSIADYDSEYYMGSTYCEHPEVLLRGESYE